MVIIKREKEEQNKSQIGKVPKDDKKLINKKPKGGKKKGMSVDEKAKVIIDIYYKKKTVLNLKEIEKYASKAGVVLQSIKDINQQLVYDNLLRCDKIGSAVFFWAFSSEGYNERK